MSFLISIRRTLKIVILPLLLLPSVIMADCNNAITPTTNHLVDNNNGTVSDPKTGLVWKKCSVGQSYNSSSNSCDGTATRFTWQAALQQADSDWRVPNIKELGSIVELSCIRPAINEVVFPATPSNKGYWSSSPNANYSNGAWIVNFGYGGGHLDAKNDFLHARLVRSGQ